VWDRAAGQLVQVLLAIVTLVAIRSPVRSGLAATAGTVLAAGALIAVVVAVIPGRGRSWPVRVARSVRRDVHASLVTKRAWPAVFVSSVVIVAGHVGVFLVAARADGSPASIRQLLPLAMLVLLAMTVPTNIGGWGPREGVAAWAFAAAGLGAAQGVATATVYGVLSLVATLPGAVVLIWLWWRGRSAAAGQGARQPAEQPATCGALAEPGGTLVGSASGSGQAAGGHAHG
jgi:uncharacterized membrane protein YbhN (UPF0104 family)